VSTSPGSIFFEQIQVDNTIEVSAIALYPLVSNAVAAASPVLNITVALYAGAAGFRNNLTLIVQSGPVVVTNFSTFTQQNVITPLLFTVPTTIVSAGAYNVVFWFTWNLTTTSFFQSSFGQTTTGPPPLYYVYPDLNGGISYTNNQGVLPPYLYTLSNQFSGDTAPGAVVSLISNCSSTPSSTGKFDYGFSSSTGNSATITQSISVISLLAIVLSSTYIFCF
jgi:hypothetical protein